MLISILINRIESVFCVTRLFPQLMRSFRSVSIWPVLRTVAVSTLKPLLALIQDANTVYWHPRVSLAYSAKLQFDNVCSQCSIHKCQLLITQCVCVCSCWLFYWCPCADCPLQVLIVPGFCFPLNDATCRLQCLPHGSADVFYELEILTFLDLTPAFGAEQDVFWSDCLILALVHFFFFFIETCRGKYEIKQKCFLCVTFVDNNFIFETPQ